MEMDSESITILVSVSAVMSLINRLLDKEESKSTNWTIRRSEFFINPSLRLKAWIKEGAVVRELNDQISLLSISHRQKRTQL